MWVALRSMKLLDDLIDRADDLQRRPPVLAFPLAVWKKFADDRAGDLAALIAYYTFVAIFPLLLILRYGARHRAAASIPSCAST